MKKIGIITITGLGNYGNRLQNYALQYIVENVSDCNCETLINRSCNLKGYIKKIVFPFKHQLTDREKFFKKFNDEFIKFSDVKINNISKSKGLLDYDCLICGSDQIWNSDYSENDKANFGYFYPHKQKVFSYAASFGTDKVVKNKQKKYSKYLKNLTAVSVREEKGKEIAVELSNRNDVCVHVDPTLLLNANEWSRLEKKPKLYNGEKYVLKYFLGNNNAEVNCQLEAFAKKNNFEIIDVISADSPYYNIGPSEFLYLEKNAQLIVTDSFHSCIFALIYNRPFVVAERKENNLQSMSSRIDTLLNKFGLESRMLTDNDLEKAALSSIDYFKVNRILQEEKAKSIEYLKENIIGK